MFLIKRYWFEVVMILLVTLFLGVVTVLLLSPKQDVDNRGFIPCTKALMDNLFDCDRKILCSIKAVLTNTKCEISVIHDGIKLWINDKQDYPWSNYIFEPKLPSSAYIDDEAVKEYLKEHPNVKADMENLHLLRKDLENENANSENYKDLWQEEQPSSMGSE
jgi:hypothetical protein